MAIRPELALMFMVLAEAIPVCTGISGYSARQH